MRKQVLFLSFILILLTAFSSFALSRYSSCTNKEKTVCCTKPAKNAETIFESMVKQFVGAVSIGK
jgi:hypothetical protein